MNPPDLTVLTIPPDLSFFNIDDMKTTTIQFLRNQRNQALKNTDIYMIPDFPNSTENKELIMNYRQSLRDFPSSEYLINYGAGVAQW